MVPVLLPLYGPFAIHSYGLMIVIGLLVFIHFLQKDPRTKTIINQEQLHNALVFGIISAIIGGRLLFYISNEHEFTYWYEFFEIWTGGFSILGSVIGILVTLPLYLYRSSIPIIPLLDLIAIYAPLLQSIARLGCFLAGCCFGKPTTVPWAFFNAELATYVHPTQLYSSILLLGIFLFMRKKAQTARAPGMLGVTYLLLESSERFFVDFFRFDQQFSSISILTFFSFNQWVCIVLCLGSLLWYGWLKIMYKHA